MRTSRVPTRRCAFLTAAILVAIAAIPQAAAGQRDDSTLAAAITHTATRLVVTPWPGYLAFPQEREAQYGTGFGVQFPVDAARPAVELSADPVMAAGPSLIASGGLVIGVESGDSGPPIIFTAQELGGAFSCPTEDAAEADYRCLAFLDGTVSSDTLGRGRKSVRWQYSDATSSTAVGLNIVQESVDGFTPADYVLFEYTITSTAASPVTFYAGVYADWDVPVYNQNVGATDLGGHVMYATAPDGPYMGTVLLGDYPIAGTHFWPNTNSPNTPRPEHPREALNVVRGLYPDGTPGGQTATGFAPEDYRYVHSLGPITLAPSEAAHFWMALIAGEDVAELRSNAVAAAAHVNQTLPEPPTITLSAIEPSASHPDRPVGLRGENLDQRWDKTVHVTGGTIDTVAAVLPNDGPSQDALRFVVPALDPGRYEVSVAMGGTHSNALTLEVRPPWVTTVEVVSGENWWSPREGSVDFEGFDGAITMEPNQRWPEPSSSEERTVEVELRFADVVETDGEEQYRPADQAGENVSLAYRYLRRADAAPPAPEELTSTANPWDFRPYIVNQPTEGPWAYQDRREIAVAAWDVSVDPPRRLAVGFLENNAVGGLVNGAYGPAHWEVAGNVVPEGPREWLFVFDLPYQEEVQPELNRDLFEETCPPDCPPYLAIVLASRAKRDRFPRQGDVIRLSHGW